MNGEVNMWYYYYFKIMNIYFNIRNDGVEFDYILLLI